VPVAGLLVIVFAGVLSGRSTPTVASKAADDPETATTDAR